MTNNNLNVGAIILNLNSRQLAGPQGQCQLNRMEFKLLSVFMRQPDQVLTRAFLMKTVWETDYLGDTRTLDVHVCWIRKKLETCIGEAQYLETIRGAGYLFTNT